MVFLFLNSLFEVKIMFVSHFVVLTLKKSLDSSLSLKQSITNATVLATPFELEVQMTVLLC